MEAFVIVYSIVENPNISERPSNGPQKFSHSEPGRHDFLRTWVNSSNNREFRHFYSHSTHHRATSGTKPCLSQPLLNKQICLQTLQINNLGTAISIPFQLCTICTTMRIADPFPRTNNKYTCPLNFQRHIHRKCEQGRWGGM